MSRRPLEGFRVLDLTHVLAGPYCTYQLALLGADVIKVEPPRGDMMRRAGGTREQISQGLGTGFVAQNAGKRSITLDLSTPEGRDVALDLANDVDILVENYRPGTIDAHGLDHERVRSSNPSIIYASISAFGRTGPHAGRPGFDDVIQATGGFMSMTVRDDEPIRAGGPVLDYATGIHAASAILAAVLLRQQTGEGQHIDIAMQDVTMLLLNRQTSITATTGIPPAPLRDREGPFLGRFEAKEGSVMLAGYLVRHRRAICRALGLDEYARLNGSQFEERADEVEAAVEAAIAERTAEEWDDVFAEAGALGGAVRDLGQVLATGQPDARRLLTEVDTAVGPGQVTNAGYLINGEALAPAFGVPRLGEHSREILGELGYSADKIERLVETNAVGTLDES
jgi:crotonobetainyl-CoA:carnitine CoA-transferase CaiB-like acyl-CoA transferase